MTDDASSSSASLRRSASRGSHFVVTRVESSSQDNVDHPDGGGQTADSGDSNPSGTVIFKIGDASVFGASQLSTSVSLKPDPTELPATTAVSPESTGTGPLLQSYSSRFHIVKLESSPYKRGRWLCKDKQEPKILTELPDKRKSAAVQVPPASSITCMEEAATKDLPSSVAECVPLSSTSCLPAVAAEIVPATASSISINETAAVPNDAQPMTTLANASATDPVLIQINGQAEDDSMTIQRNKHVAVDHHHMDAFRLHGSSSAFIDSVVEQFGTDQIVKEFGSQAATGTGASPDSDVTSSDVAIDNKIEQAMDLVKTHLLYAVREEVDLFKERIERLERVSRRLEAENKVLREHVSADVLAELNTILASKGFVSSPASAPSLALTLSSATATPKSVGGGSGGGVGQDPAKLSASSDKDGGGAASGGVSKPGVG